MVGDPNVVDEERTTAEIAAQLERVRLESDTLYRIIGVIAVSPEVSQVLAGVVELLTEATGCHACFIYLRESEVLRLRAATPTYSHLVDRVTIPVSEGLVGWAVANGQPAFLPERALEDPRFKYVPQLSEESFQSMIALPVPARAGRPIGAISLNTEAPHEFHPETVTFLAHTASLLAGAIETAQLYEDARLRVEALTTLSRISQDIAATDRPQDLYRIATRGARELLQCESCHLYEVDSSSGELELVAASPSGVPEPTSIPLPGDGSVEVSATEGTPNQLVADVSSGGERLGLLRVAGARPWRATDADLVGAIANQTAVALKRAQLIERLTEENLVRDLFEALAAGRAEVARARAQSIRCDLERDHMIVRIEPAAAPESGPSMATTLDAAGGELRRLSPGAVIDVQPEAIHGILLGRRPRDEQADEMRRASLQRLGEERKLVIGHSEAHRGSDGLVAAMNEARDALRVARSLMPAGGLLAYSELGAYRYLLHVDPAEIPQDSYRTAVRELSDYDARRTTQLSETLEHYLEQRGSVRGTASALHIHPNTVRQRLERIDELTGLALADADLLALEVVVKLARLGRL